MTRPAVLKPVIYAVRLPLPEILNNINIRRLGLQDYQETWQDMRRFTEQRISKTNDELWIVEHRPVYTLGLNGRHEHLLHTGNIPVIQSDRGGQVTYHGPGQLVIYPLVDIMRLQLGVRQLVTMLEQAMIETLSQYGIHAEARADAPGVYVADKKIGSIGLRIRKGCSYHGLSLNNNMDLTPFNNINICGFPELKVTQLAEQGILISNHELAIPVTHFLTKALQQCYDK